MFSKILVGTDGFGPATKAVERAVELAETTGAELIVAHAYPPPEHAALMGAPAGHSGEDSGRGLLTDVQKHHGARANIRPVLKEGDPTDVLLDIAEAENVDVIVVGSQGMTGPRRRVLGSVPNRISHHAPCTVLIANTTD